MSGPTPLDPSARWKTFAVLAVVGLLAAGIVLDRMYFRKHGPKKHMAPEVTFYDRGGKPVSLEDYRGKVVLLNFWATWCGPCVEEAPSLDSLSAQLKRELPDVVVLAPALDDEGFEAVDPFVEKLNLSSITIVHDKDREAFKFGTRKLPETWLIARDGEIVERFVGAYDWTRPEIFELLKKVAEEGPGALKKNPPRKTTAQAMPSEPEAGEAAVRAGRRNADRERSEAP